ncbi:DUF5009 domain-containing protein [Sphingobacterium daejeonense]|uniref:DUF5009 domain-containing protein n=1 Tax=Sphingobacterium daejeonense TaxID=371142 RepID=UPI0021A7FC07|nr:DUF5009 domain-containing protein [Sphingobacterium daejeonense]MCT1529446.1 DUF5009 domain-containing protein [Sphingobacterium daejeonense]
MMLNPETLSANLSASTKIRVRAIDIMRGLTLFLMLFVNDLYTSNVPKWLLHTEADVDGMGLSDWVFPGFLFMVGMAIPYAVSARKKKGDSDARVFIHILFRTISLLIIGLLIVNSSSLNPELTGMPRLWWIGLVYVCIFLVWNNYPKDKYKNMFLILKVIGVIGLIYLSVIFRAGSVDTPIWFERSWWGILGLIGWGYFAGSSVYLLIKERIWWSILAVLLFLFLNIASMNGWVPNLFPGQDWFNVLLQGNVPMIVMSGITATLIVRKFSRDWKKLAIYLTLFGLISLVLGLILHQWFIVSKILATPSWGMLCNGISILLFVLIYYLIDVRGNSKYSKLFELAGQNSLTTYLAPDLIYFIIWGSGLSILFYKQDFSMWLAVIGSLIWAYAMLWFGLLLNRIGIKLKL